MMNKMIIGIAAGVALNVWASLAGRGSFLHHVAVLGCTVWIGLPLFVVGGVVFVIGRRKASPRLLSGAVWLLLAGLVVASSLVSLIPGRRSANADISAAQRYCEEAANGLEEVKAKTGLYPTNLPSSTASLPRLLNAHAFFWSDGTNYQFTFPDPTGMMDMFGFDNGNKKWQKWD